MAFADTAKMIVDLSLKGNFRSALLANQKALSSFDKSVDKTGTRAFKAGQQLGNGLKNSAYIAAGAVGFLATNIGLGLRQLIELESITAQTNAVLKSTQGVAGQTAKSIRDLSEKYEALNATMDDKVIQSGANLLLTFTNIRKEAFEPTLKAALDMNQALGGGEAGLAANIRLLGKAMQDPEKGLARLGRAVGGFSDETTAAVKEALKANDTFKAQSIILAELDKRYGQSFLAQGNTTAGKVALFKDAIEDLQKALATALLPTIGKVADRLSKFLADQKVITTVERLGASIAELFNDENMAEGGKVLSSLFDTAKAAAPVVKDAAVATLGAVKAAVSLFTSLPKEVQSLAIGAFAINKITGGLVTNLAGGLISSVLKQLVSGVVNVNGAVVNVVGAGGLPGVAGAAGAAAGAGGLTAGAAATAVAVPTILIGGALLSLNEIANYAGKNNLLAARGLNHDEITAVKFYNSSLAEQQTARKHLAFMPSKADFESGMAKLRATTSGSATRTKDDLVKAMSYETGSLRQRIESAKIAGVTSAAKTTNAVLSARDRIAAAARASGQQAAFAIRDKDLSVRTTVNNAISVTTRVSVLETIKTTTTYKKIGNVYVS